MDNITINPKQTPENEPEKQEVKQELNTEKITNIISENKNSEIKKENTPLNADEKSTLSSQKPEENSARNIYGTSPIQQPARIIGTQTPTQETSNRQTVGQPPVVADDFSAQPHQQQPAGTGQQQSQQVQPPMPAPMGQPPITNHATAQAENPPKNTFETTTSPQEKNTNKKPKNKKEPAIPKSEKAKNKTKNTVITVGFIAGLTCAAVLFAVGFSMNSKLTKQNLLNPTVRPTIEIKEPDDLENALSTIQTVQKVEPSVVSIDVYVEDEISVAGSGSGVIFSEDGYIVTNAHVVEDAYALRVILNDETGYTATLVGEDVKNDLAVIKINAEGLTPAEFGDSDQVQMGEKVIAIGNAVGVFPGSPTQGIISGVNRQIPMSTVDGSSGYRTLLQTDAAINPGNSGGALVNSYGQVIGINVAKLSDTSIENIGFAIPSNTVTSTVTSIFEQEENKEMPSIGIAFVELNDTNGPTNNLPSSGLYIQAISENSDLYNSDAKEGDIVTAVNGQEIKTVKEVRAIFAGLSEGDTVELTVLDPKTEETFTVEAKLYDPSYMSSGYTTEEE